MDCRKHALAVASNTKTETGAQDIPRASFLCLSKPLIGQKTPIRRHVRHPSIYGNPNPFPMQSM